MAMAMARWLDGGVGVQGGGTEMRRCQMKLIFRGTTVVEVGYWCGGLVKSIKSMLELKLEFSLTFNCSYNCIGTVQEGHFKEDITLEMIDRKTDR
jgi:hypothetical protein